MKRIALLPLLLSLALAAPAQSTNDYALRSDLAAYAPLSALAGYVTFSALADYALISDLSAYPPISDLSAYATQSSLTNYALLSDLSAYATRAALSGFLTSSDLSDYALLSDLSAYATASDLSELSARVRTNVFTDAYFDSYLGFWHIEEPVDFEADVVLNGNNYADGLTVGNTGITLGDETRTNWNEVQSLTIHSPEDAGPTANDSFIWSICNDNEHSVYLREKPGATNRTRTVVVRHVDVGGGDSTLVYDATSSTNTLLLSLDSTDATAVIDWCPALQRWIPR